MAVPYEKHRALKKNKEFLEELCDPGKTPRVPSTVRNKARELLRQFPLETDAEQLVSTSRVLK